MDAQLKKQVELADKIIAAYKEHYNFPCQGESHMHDCITSEIEALVEQSEKDAAQLNKENMSLVCGHENLVKSLHTVINRHGNSEKSAIRLNGLEKLCSSEDLISIFSGKSIWQISGAGEFNRHGAVIGEGLTFGEAIDAAMEQTK